jgi:putative DNA primase/helicase
MQRPEISTARYREWRPSLNGAKSLQQMPAAKISPPERETPNILDIDCLLKLVLPPREYLLEPILPAKGLLMLYGARGLGKTFAGLGMAYAASSGGGFLRWRAPKSRRVLYIDGEMPAVALQERLNAIVRANREPMPTSLRFLTADLHPEPLPDLSDPDNQEWLESVWGEPPELLVLDNLSALTSAARDNEADAWTTMQRWLLSLRRRGVSVLFIHHAAKRGQQRGTSRREDILDTVISLRRPADYSPKEGARFEVHLEKARGLSGEGAEPFEASLSMESGEMRWTWKPLEDARLARAAALFNDDYTVADVADALGLSNGTAGRLRKRAVAEGLFNGA